MIEWTNPSVKKLAGSSDPTLVIVEKVRKIMLDEMDNGWRGPPFDVFSLAQRRGLSVVPREDVLDARLTVKAGKMEIEYNPNASYSRVRFSIAHEIAHTLFPDHAESIHNRSGETQRQDEWQLELLCNIAAAEILMPVGPSFDEEKIDISIDKIMEVRNKFRVSMEAALLRIGKLTSQPITVFAASRKNDDKNADFRIDYVVKSPTSTVNLRAGMTVSSDRVLSECMAIGYTAKKRERWFPELPELDIECVGVAPYPNRIYPRVLGIIRTRKKADSEPLAIRYLIGDALEPRGENHKIIAHIVNDKSRNWGGGFGGFALAVAKKWPKVAKDFQKWARGKNNLKLGNSHLYTVSRDLSIFHMIAQHGYGYSEQPRIRYVALRECLESLVQQACSLSATVHMPKIGTGYAGGSWAVISELIDETLIKRGVDVTVYTPPGKEGVKEIQTLSSFSNPLNNS